MKSYNIWMLQFSAYSRLSFQLLEIYILVGFVIVGFCPPILYVSEPELRTRKRKIRVRILFYRKKKRPNCGNSNNKTKHQKKNTNNNIHKNRNEFIYCHIEKRVSIDDELLWFGVSKRHVSHSSIDKCFSCVLWYRTKRKNTLQHRK